MLSKSTSHEKNDVNTPSRRHALSSALLHCLKHFKNGACDVERAILMVRCEVPQE